jgi:hypothetical protein
MFKVSTPIEWANLLCSLKFTCAERSPSDLKTGLQGLEFENFTCWPSKIQNYDLGFPPRRRCPYRTARTPPPCPAMRRSNGVMQRWCAIIRSIAHGKELLTIRKGRSHAEFWGLGRQRLKSCDGAGYRTESIGRHPVAQGNQKKASLSVAQRR